MKTNKERTDSILKKTKEKKAARLRTAVIAATACLSAAVIAFNLVLFLPYPPAVSPIAKYESNEYYPVIRLLHTHAAEKNAKPTYKNNFEKWTAGLKEIFSNGLIDFGTGGNKADAPTNDLIYMPEWDEDSSEDGASGNNEYVETTDNQVEGVIEGDLVKRTNDHVFYLYPSGDGSKNHTLRVYSIQGLHSSRIMEYQVAPPATDMRFYSDVEMYLSQDGDALTVIGSCYRVKDPSELYTVLTQLDVSDPTHIREIGMRYIAGELRSSRFTDGSLFIVNNFSVGSGFDFEKPESYLPRYGAWQDMDSVAAADIVCPDVLTTTAYTVVCRLDAEGLKWQDVTALLSYSSDVYASENNFFVSRSYTERKDISETERVQISKTDIACISYADGGLSYVGKATVDGSVKDQYSMDEYENVLRVVTTTNELTYKKRSYSNGAYWSMANDLTNASLYCIDLRDFDTLASVENFAPAGETVESVRFDGVKAYVCTAVVIMLTDPVYAFDLSDLTNITCVGTGEIDGYSSSLVDLKDGYLLGIGYGESGGLKLEIYKETGNNMEIVDSYEEGFDFSEEYKSYLIDRENGYIGIGVTDWNWEGEYKGGASRYLLFLFDMGREEIDLVVNEYLPGVNEYKRGLLIDGCLYMFGGEFKVIEL